MVREVHPFQIIDNVEGMRVVGLVQLEFAGKSRFRHQRQSVWSFQVYAVEIGPAS